MLTLLKFLHKRANTKKDIMKSLSTLLIICFLGYSSCNAQSKESTLKDTVKQMNLLDEQTKMFGNIFEMAGLGNENPLGGAENYMELIEKMDASEEQKEILREQYKVYDLSLDPSKKDSLKIAVGKMLENAMEKTKNDTDN